MSILASDLSSQQICKQLLEIAQRVQQEPGHRQVPFNTVEKALCYGLFYICNPHRYGGGNIHTVPESVKQLAHFFQRSPGSITSKMLNMDGSRTHSSGEDTLLFALFAENPEHYLTLYRDILAQARSLAIDEQRLPDFLAPLSPAIDQSDILLGQDDLPGVVMLLAEEEQTIATLKQSFSMDTRQTEKMVERKIRLVQHLFARDVLRNCGEACVFCGFSPATLPEKSHLLRASHIKPWAASNPRERVDIRNGLAACPMHDVAFDQGYLTINGGYSIHRASVLQQSMVRDPQVTTYFGDSLSPTLLLPAHATRPGPVYLDYHRSHIFKGEKSTGSHNQRLYGQD